MEISPFMENAENILILGGNHHIRLLNYTEGASFVIQKAGFSKELMVNDIRVRKENPYLPTPLILDIAEDGSWYSEELILGTPVNRLVDKKQEERAVLDVMAPLVQLYEKSVRKVNADEYAIGIVDRIKDRIKTNFPFDEIIHENLFKDLLELDKIIRYLQNKEIFVAQTHGDFQPANILLGEEHTWLIDWEYTAERQIGYDGLVFCMGARTSLALEQSVPQAINNDLPEFGQLLLTIPYIQWQNKAERHVMLALFLLEELDLKVMEVCNPMFFSTRQRFEVFQKELKQGVQIIAGVC